MLPTSLKMSSFRLLNLQKALSNLGNYEREGYYSVSHVWSHYRVLDNP